MVKRHMGISEGRETSQETRSRKKGLWLLRRQRQVKFEGCF